MFMAMADGEHKDHRKRMKRKLYEFGADIFSDHELIEILLYSYVPRVNTNPTAHELLNRAGSLAELLDMNSEELAETKKLTHKAAERIPFLLPAVYEAILRESKNGGNAKAVNTFSDLVSHAASMKTGSLCVCACKNDSTMGAFADFPSAENPDFRRAAELAFFFGTRKLSFAERSDVLSPVGYNRCRSVLGCAEISIAHYLVMSKDKCYDFAKGRFISLE